MQACTDIFASLPCLPFHFEIISSSQKNCETSTRNCFVLKHWRVTCQNLCKMTIYQVTHYNTTGKSKSLGKRTRPASRIPVNTTGFILSFSFRIWSRLLRQRETCPLMTASLYRSHPCPVGSDTHTTLRVEPFPGPWHQAGLRSRADTLPSLRPPHGAGPLQPPLPVVFPSPSPWAWLYLMAFGINYSGRKERKRMGRTALLFLY